MIIGPITLIGRGDHAASAEWYAGELERRCGWPYDPIRNFLRLNPLDEVVFEFHLETDTGAAYCTKIDIGDGEPFTRPYPGQQLTLF